jgi:acyl-CoA dehydrogenase
MIDFSLTEEQRQLQELAHEFAKNEMRPVAAHHDRTGEFPLEVCRKAWKLGLLNIHIPQEYGGLGLGVLDACLMSEELAWGCSGIRTVFEANSLASMPLILGGTPEQKKRFLVPMLEELRFAAYCVTESGAGSDVAGIRTLARRVGEDYVLSGSKMWITSASKASWYFVLAYTDPEQRHRGMSGFIVPADSPGIEVGAKEQNMGQRASDTRGITFSDVVVPASLRLGAEGDGWKLAMGAFDHTRPPIAAAAVGLARSAMEHAIDYARERQAFGRPLSEFQGVSFMIADMAKDIEAARMLTWRAAWLIDQGERNTKFAAFAKAFAADTAMRVTTDAVQVFGGYGYSQEYPVEKLMRDAKIFQIYEGTSQIQRVVIARELLRE